MAERTVLQVFVFIMAANTVMGSDVQIRRQCRPDESSPSDQICYYLYHSPGGVNWEAAMSKCSENSQAMTTLQDEKSQGFVNNLLTSSGLSHDKGHVWISGNRSADNKWRYMYGHRRTEGLYGGHPSDRLCGKFQYGTTHAQSDECTTQKNHHALCQYALLKSGSCLADHVFHDGQCYHVSRSQMTWFEANNYCSTEITGNKLAINKIPRSILDDAMINHPQNSNPRYFWLALTRYPWQWVGRSGSTLEMNYYYFSAGEGGDAAPGCCLYVKPAAPSGENIWADDGCDVSKSYYMCQITEAIKTPIPETTRTPIPGVTNAPNPDPTPARVPVNPENPTAASTTVTDPSITQGQGQTEGQNTKPSLDHNVKMYIIVGVCSFVVFAALIVVIALLIKKRKNSKKATEAPNKFSNLRHKTITKEDISVVVNVPGDLPEHFEANYSALYDVATVAAAYCTVGNKDDRTNVVQPAPSDEWDSDFDDEDNVSPYAQSQDDVLRQSDGRESIYANVVRRSEHHEYLENGDVYTLPSKSAVCRLDFNDECIDNDLYGSTNESCA